MKINEKQGTRSRRLVGFTGYLTIIGGGLYSVIQFLHPDETLSSVGTTMWSFVAYLTALMSLFMLIGMTTHFLIQREEYGYSGYVGYIMLCIFWLISMNYSLIEAMVIPLLVQGYPKFVEGFIGVFSGGTTSVNLGVFPVLTGIAGGTYILGGFITGLSTIKAGIFSKISGLILSGASFLTILASFIPHPFDRLLALPMSFALILIGTEIVRYDR